MTDIAYGPLIAMDPTTGQLLPDAEGQVFAITDTTFSSPIPMKDLSGVTMTLLKTSRESAQFDEFLVADLLELNWKSGPNIVRLTSFKGLQIIAEAAKAAAQASAAAAAAAEQRVMDYIAQNPGGGGGGGVTVHGLLSGLDVDDHKQYLTVVRGDSRYYTQAAINQSLVDVVANRLRFDNPQTLSTAQKTQAKANIGLPGFTIAGARLASDPVLTDAQALALYGEGAFFTVDPA